MDGETTRTSRKCRAEGCGRIVWGDGGEGLCVFHSTRSEEKAGDFARAWSRFLEKHRSGDAACRYLNCGGFVFPGGLDFSGICLQGGADFREARFDGPARFDGVRVHENIYFTGARFAGEARFEGAHFEKTANFDGARFEADAFFEEARFAGRAEFRRSDFLGRSRFPGSRFEADALFREGHCEGGLRFDGACFRARLDFHGAAGGSISLEGADLSGADLRECSLRNVHITHVTRHKGVRFGPTDVSGVDWAGSRSLREKARHQNSVFDFRRRNAFCRYFLYPLWKITSDCGRSILPWAAVSASLILAFGALYASKGVDWFPGAAAWDALTPYVRSAATLATLGLGGVEPRPGCSAARIAVTVAGVLGGVMLGGLLALLAAKIARRHS